MFSPLDESGFGMVEYFTDNEILSEWGTSSF